MSKNLEIGKKYKIEQGGDGFHGYEGFIGSGLYQGTSAGGDEGFSEVGGRYIGGHDGPTDCMCGAGRYYPHITEWDGTEIYLFSPISDFTEA
jgi:hypothetical protein